MRRSLLAVALTLALAPSAVAAGWTPTADLLPPGGLADFNVQALGPNGDAAVLWLDTASDKDVITASTRAPGVAFPHGSAIGPTDVLNNDADAAIDAAGNLVVVYLSGTSAADRTVSAIVRPRGGTFSPPQVLNAAASVPLNPRVEMNAAGFAVAVWVDTGPGVDIGQSAIRPPGGTFEAATAIAPVVSTLVDVAVDGAGNVLASYLDEDFRFTVKRRLSGAPGFGAPEPVSGEGQQELNQRLAVNDAGHAVLAWTASNHAWAAYAAPGGSFSANDDLGLFSNTSAPEIALDAAGNTLLAWESGDHAVLTRRAAGGVGGEPETLGGPDSLAGGVVMTPDGSLAIVIWSIKDADLFTRVEASLGSFTGAFAPGEPISPAGVNASDPYIAMQPDGDALVSWIRSGTGEQIPQARAYDRNAPALNGLSIPATGVAGQPVPMSVAPLDTWSAFSAAWSFGDGGASSDASTSHVYAAPGTYDVSVSATDALGQARGGGGQVVVSAAPGPSTTIPVLGSLSLKPKRFRAFRRGGSIVGTIAAKRGTRVRYSLDVAARVIFRAQKRRGKKWRRVRGKFGVDSLAGANQFRFSGRMRGKRLRPGRYRLSATPRNGAGKGAVSRARFRIVRR